MDESTQWKKQVNSKLSEGDTPPACAEVLRQGLHLLNETENELQKSLENNRNLINKFRSSERRRKFLKNRLIYHEKTGLPNHTVLDAEINKIFAEANQLSSGRTITVFFISLDRSYEVIRRNLPDTIGEWILYSTAERLKSYAPKNSRIYQSRDNEFMLLIMNPVEEISDEERAKELHNIVEDNYRFPGYSVSIGCFIGYSRYPDHGSTKGALLKNADLALGAARERNVPYMEYHQELADEVVERMELQNSIIRALEEQAIQEINKQFSLFFQPIVEVFDVQGKQVNYRIVGHEALIRWNHSTKGSISPDRFIPLAEESGLIIPIGNWVFYQATQEIEEWTETGEDPLFLAVNLSPRQFKDTELTETISRVVDNSRIDPSLLHIEITETSVMDDPEEAEQVINSLKSIGVGIVMDDFGTGYSSLSILQQLPIDTIKIDRSFVADCQENESNRGIIRAIIGMAESLKVQVIAEGIETPQQAEYLFKTGCRYMQGYLFSKPMSRGDVLRHLKDGNRPASPADISL
ncbi:MAG: GGDEF domain-containing phosphodiesterase [Spirochaetales bacterium]|nr:GGDEF domain-containing phosphodiesterase [Spirochaetales bacterium]MCF7939040.1 GGDEF domain-containing phosphodiesterase [Spirochaetales bacterium]